MEWEKNRRIFLTVESLLAIFWKILIVMTNLENLLLSVVNATDSCIYAKDKDLRFVFVNAAVSSLYEADAESMIGKSDIDFIDPVQSALFNEADRRIFNSGQKECFRFEVEIEGVVYTAEDHKFPVVINGANCIAGIGILTPKET